MHGELAVLVLRVVDPRQVVRRPEVLAHHSSQVGGIHEQNHPTRIAGKVANHLLHHQLLRKRQFPLQNPHKRLHSEIEILQDVLDEVVTVHHLCLHGAENNLEDSVGDVAVVLNRDEFLVETEAEDANEALEHAGVHEPLEGPQDVPLRRVRHGDGKDGLPAVHDGVEERVASRRTVLVAEVCKELDHALPPHQLVWFAQHILHVCEHEFVCHYNLTHKCTCIACTCTCICSPTLHIRYVQCVYIHTCTCTCTCRPIYCTCCYYKFSTQYTLVLIYMYMYM